MSALVYMESHKEHKIKIYYDTEPEDPRDWDNLGTMICSHSRYSLGDKHSFVDACDFLTDLCDISHETDLPTSRIMERANQQAVILPIFLYDHSGLAMNTSGFHCPWDSGQVGYIYVTHEDIRKEYNVVRVSAKLRERVTDQLRNEVATYHNYLCGNVFGYTVQKDGEDVDSCWGFNGDYESYCLAEARNSIAA